MIEKEKLKEAQPQPLQLKAPLPPRPQMSHRKLKEEKAEPVQKVPVPAKTFYASFKD